MFSSRLYDHKFDIDDIIRALCGDTLPGTWQLDTRTGELLAIPQGQPVPPADHQRRLYAIEPLTISVLPSFRHHANYAKLAPATVAEVDDLTTTTTSLNALTVTFNTTPGGAFFRERFKDIALEWLDERDLIPPSMRHVKDAAPRPVNTFTGTPRKVTIS